MPRIEEPGKPFLLWPWKVLAGSDHEAELTLTPLITPLELVEIEWHDDYLTLRQLMVGQQNKILPALQKPELRHNEAPLSSPVQLGHMVIKGGDLLTLRFRRLVPLNREISGVIYCRKHVPESERNPMVTA